MDPWRWAPVPSDLLISAGSSISVNVLSDRQQLAVTYTLIFNHHPPPLIGMSRHDLCMLNFTVSNLYSIPYIIQ